MGSGTKAHPQRWENLGNWRSAMDRANIYLTLPYLTLVNADALLPLLGHLYSVVSILNFFGG